MNDEKRTWLTAAALIALALVAPGTLSAAEETTDAPAVEVERRIVYREGFEGGDGKMTVWADKGTYKVNFAGPTDERAATGKRSFKIDVTWLDCPINSWWTGVMIPFYGNPVVRGKVYVESGRAWFGHSYAIPEAGITGGREFGVETPLPDGWTAWRSSARGTPGSAAYVEGVAVYLQTDGKERRTVVYVDDLEIEAALPEGYRAGLDERIAEIEAARTDDTQTRLQNLAGTLPARFAELTAGIDAMPSVFPPAASAELKDYWERLCRHRDETRAQLKTQLAELRVKLSSPVVDSARQLLAQLERAHPACRSLSAYAAAHPALPYIVWIADPTSNHKVLPRRFPVPGIAGTELSVSACPGEYEPASFSVYAFEELRDVTVQCSDARSGELTLPASHIDIRIVKCWWQDGVGLGYGGEGRQPTFTPELLLRDPEFVSVDNQKQSNTLKDPEAPRDARELQPVPAIPAATAQQFWITVHVPEEAKAGTYRATLTMRPRNAPEMAMPLTIEVLPFKLEEPALTYSIYYSGQLAAKLEHSIDQYWKSPEQYLAELRNLKAHGVSHPTMCQDFGHPDLFDRAMELRKQAAVVVDPLYSLGIVTHGPPATPEALETLTAKLRSALAQLDRHGIKNLYIYGIDEATGEQLENERTAFEAVHETGAKVFVACGRDSFELVGDLLDLAVYGGPPTPGEAGKWHSVGHRIFSYNHPQVGLEQPETYRRNFGLVLWKSGYDGTMNYAYQHASGDIYVDDDGPSFRDHVFAYPTVDGVIDTIQWEGFREGVDDVRYLTTLLKEIERDKAADDKAALAKEAEAWVATMDPGGDLQALRAKMIEWILRLRN